jgi:hypothetical protein
VKDGVFLEMSESKSLMASADGKSDFMAFPW